MTTQPNIRFAAIGLNHGHIFGQTDIYARVLGRSWFHFMPRSRNWRLCTPGAIRKAELASSEQEILDDESIQLVISAGILCDRAPIGHQGNAARQRLHERQTGFHHA